MSSMQLVTLSENSAPAKVNLIAEWGLSFLLRTKNNTILFDTGRNISAYYNAQLLGIDLNEIDKIVLSHSHSDHTGGLRYILERMDKRKEIEIIAHPDIWSERYARYDNEKNKYTGMPFKKEELEKYGARFHLTRESIEINKEMITSGEIPLVTDFEEMHSGKIQRLILKDGKYIEDTLLDDLAIFFKSEKGLIIITGCAHRGIVNTIYHAQNLTGIKNVYAVIGGAHLFGASQERIDLTINALKELNVKKIGLCHCTGLKAISSLMTQLPEKFVSVVSGSVLTF